MKINDFRKIIQKTVKLIAEKHEELSDEEFKGFIARIDFINAVMKSKKGKEIIDEIEG